MLRFLQGVYLNEHFRSFAEFVHAVGLCRSLLHRCTRSACVESSSVSQVCTSHMGRVQIYVA